MEYTTKDDLTELQKQDPAKNYVVLVSTGDKEEDKKLFSALKPPEDYKLLIVQKEEASKITRIIPPNEATVIFNISVGKIDGKPQTKIYQIQHDEGVTDEYGLYHAPNLDSKNVAADLQKVMEASINVIEQNNKIIIEKDKIKSLIPDGLTIGSGGETTDSILPAQNTITVANGPDKIGRS